MSDINLNIDVSGSNDLVTIKQRLVALEKAYSGLVPATNDNTKAQTAAEKATKKLEDATKTLTRASELQKKYNLDSGTAKLIAQTEKVTTVTEQQILALRKAHSEYEKIQKSSRGAAEGMRILGINFGAIVNFSIGLTVFSAITTGLNELKNTIIKTEQTKLTLSNVTSSAAETNALFNSLTSSAEKLAIPLLSLPKAFADFSIAAQGTTLSGKEVRSIFDDITVAGAGAGLQAEQFDGVMRALTQIMSKGTVQAEELRGQLGDRLPGAFTIAARSMGITTGELDKMLKAGKVTSEEFLRNFGPALRETFGEAATKRLGTFGGALQNLNNQFTKTGIALADLQGSNFASGINLLSKAVEFCAKNFNTLFNVLVSITAALVTAKAGMVVTTVATAAMGTAATTAAAATGGLRAALAALNLNPIVAILTVAAGALTYFYLQAQQAKSNVAALDDKMKGLQKTAAQLAKDASLIDLSKVISEGDIGAIKLAANAYEAAQTAQRDYAASKLEGINSYIQEIELNNKAIQKYGENSASVADLVAKNKQLQETLDIAKRQYNAAASAAAGYTAKVVEANAAVAAATAQLPSSIVGTKKYQDLIAEGNALRNGTIKSYKAEKEAIAIVEEQMKSNLQAFKGTAEERKKYIDSQVAITKAAILYVEAGNEAAKTAKKAETLQEKTRASALKELESLRERVDLLKQNIETDEAARLIKLANLNLNAKEKAEYKALSDEIERLQAEKKKEIAAQKEKDKLDKQNARDLENLTKLKDKATIAENANILARQLGISVTDATAIAEENYQIAKEESERTSNNLVKAETAVANARIANAKRIAAAETASQARKDDNPLANFDFGSLLGKSIGNPFSEALDGIQTYSEELTKLNKERQLYDVDQIKYAKEIKAVETAKDLAAIKGTTAVLAATKKFFKEKSAGYKIISTAEKAFRALELALSIKNSIRQVLDVGKVVGAKIAGYIASGTAAVTGAGIEVAAAGTVGAANATAAVAGASIGIGPTGFATGAAMAAAMAALGFATGAFGGSKGKGQTAASRQAVQGTGTVLGDPKAKSESLIRSLDALKNLQSDGLFVSKGMLVALRNIESNISGFASLLFRANAATGGATPFNVSGSKNNLPGQQFLTAGGGLDALGLGGIKKAIQSIPIVGDILKLGDNLVGSLIGGLFGKTKLTQIDSGINFASQKLGDILAGNLQATYYAVIKKTTKSFFGLVKSSSTQTITAQLEQQTANQIGLIFSGITEAIVQSVGVFGIKSQDALAQLSQIKVELGKISLEGLSGEEATKAIQNVFGAFADNLVGQIIPAVSEFQKVGEGLFETLTRVASETLAISAALKNLGFAVGQTGIETVRAYQELIDLAGGISELSSSLSSFYDKFYTDEEKFKNNFNSLITVFASLGRTLPATRQGFRDLATSMDVTTEAGRNNLYALLQIQDAADEYYSKIETAAREAADALKDFLSSVEDLRTSLSKSILSLGGGSPAAFDLNQVRSAISKATTAGEVLALIDPLSKALEGVYNEKLQTIEKEKQAKIAAVNETNALQKTSLNAQRDALKAQIDNAEKLRDIAKNIREYVIGLSINAATSTGTPLDQLAAAKAEFQRLVALAKTGDVDAAGKVTSAAGDVLGLARDIYASSDQYKTVFDSVKGTLGSVASVLENTKSDNSLLASIEQKLADLDKKQQAQIDAINASAEKQIAAAKEQFKQQLGVLLNAVQLLGQLAPSDSGLTVTDIRDGVLQGTVPLNNSATQIRNQGIIDAATITGATNTVGGNVTQTTNAITAQNAALYQLRKLDTLIIYAYESTAYLKAMAYKQNNNNINNTDYLANVQKVVDRFAAEGRYATLNSASAKGNVFNGGSSVMKFANGGSFTNGIVDKPSLFPMGLMGEAGPEAIMPLSRGSDGSLGVKVNSGSSGDTGSGVIQELRALRSDMQKTDNTIMIRVITPDGKTIKEETIRDIKKRSRNGEIIVYTEGIAA